MTSNRRGGRGLLFASAVLAGCLSSSPPLPPVRWFDPTPEWPADGAVAAPLDVRVEGMAASGREFVVRVGPHELAIDAQHQWFAEPRQLVGTVLARALAATPTSKASVTVELLAFELDVTAAPHAHVRVAFVGTRPNALPPVLDVVAPATDRSPTACAAAMAQALATWAGRVRDR